MQAIKIWVNMIFSFIIKVLLCLAGLFLLCIAFISKLNRSSGKVDQQQYDKNFNPYKPLSFYADGKEQEDSDEFDNDEVKFYKQRQVKH